MKLIVQIGRLCVLRPKQNPRHRMVSPNIALSKIRTVENSGDSHGFEDGIARDLSGA